MTEDDTTNWFSEETATFGDRLAVAREAQGMTQKTLSKRLGVALKTVEAWENDTREPRANRLQLTSGLLNVSMKWLLTGEGHGPEFVEPVSDDGDLHDLMAEMRVLRTQMNQAAEQMGKIEKRLRTAMAAA